MGCFHRELVWEIVSLYIFNALVWPVIMMLVLILLSIGSLFHKDRGLRSLEIVKEKIHSQHTQQGDNGHDHDKDPRYVHYHYKDHELVAKLRASQTEHAIFHHEIRDPVWECLHRAKDSIDPLLLRNKISDHIMAMSTTTEGELSPFRFNAEIVSMESIIHRDDDSVWYHQFEPLSQTLFKYIEADREGILPLHMFNKYPFDIKDLLDDIENFFEESPDHERIALKHHSKEDILDAMEHLKFLDCKDSDERQYIVDTIEESPAYDADNNSENEFFPRFMVYLQEVTSLFHSVGKIKNMLRDVSKAIVERGIDCEIVADQMYFLFDDVRDSIVAMPLFRAMRPEVTENGKEALELWTIRNTLWTLYFLHNSTRKKILKESVRDHVTKKEVCDLVFEMYSDEVFHLNLVMIQRP